MSGVTLPTGAVWGIAGAVAMVVVMQARGGEAPPPFAVFWAEFVGDGDPDAAMPQALVLHLVYAAGAGAVFAAVFSSFDLGLPITGFAGGIVWGLVWAAVLFVVGAVGWVNGVLGMDPEREQVLTFALAHLAYGVSIGVLGAAVPHLV
ncbi:MAG: hypothetical protein ABEH77_10610 [Halobacteriaceae archaeon]